MRSDYQAWLEAQKYGGGTVTAQLHRSGRVEQYYGDLDQHFRADHLQAVIDALRYTSDDDALIRRRYRSRAIRERIWRRIAMLSKITVAS